jgi:hypothetical protein
MIEALYWWDEAAKFKECARVSRDPHEQRELIELAEVCGDVAARVEERATGG